MADVVLSQKPMPFLRFSYLCLVGITGLGSLPSMLGQSIVSNVSFNQQVFSTDRQTGTQYFAPVSFTGSSVPSGATTSVTTPYGGLLNAQYSISDNGSSAVFSYNISYTLHDWDSVALQGASGNTVPVLFTTSQNLSYSLSIQNVIVSHSGTEAQLKNYANLGSSSGTEFDITFNPTTGESYTATGTLAPSTYGLIVGMSAGLGSGISFPASGDLQASQTVTLTLFATAVPEPSTYALLAGAAAFVAMIWVRKKRVA